ncbi:MAG: hypothetical protein JWL63_865 [Rhodocyclales bacterium]|nr:hypothetical protein [Rhodocyclales bacterium]
MTNKKHTPGCRLQRLPALLALTGLIDFLAVAGASPAWAAGLPDRDHDPVRENEVLGVTATQEIRYDSNIFKLSDGSSTALTSDAGQQYDFISTTSLRLGLNKEFGRHRLYLLAAPSVVRYARFNDLDYVGQDFLADWSGRVGTDGRYGLNYEHLKFATDPADQQVPTGNRVTRDQLGADLAIPTGAHWQAVTAWRADRSRNSSGTEQGGDNHGWAADGGIRFIPTSGNNIDLRYRHSHYDYPNVIPSVLADNTYTQNELELSGNVQLNEPSRLEGRISFVRREHENFAERDFSGWVGSLRYLWRPTTATSLATRIFRDLGAVSDSSASYAKSYGIGIQPVWKATSKIALGSMLEWRRRSYSGFALESRAPDRTTKVGVSARYAVTRNWLLGFNVSDERRRSSAAAQNYSDVISWLSAEWKM